LICPGRPVSSIFLSSIQSLNYPLAHGIDAFDSGSAILLTILGGPPNASRVFHHIFLNMSMSSAQNQNCTASPDPEDGASK
jgi:hypothetical protein